MDVAETPAVQVLRYGLEEDLGLLIRRILALSSHAVNTRLRALDGPTESQWRPLHCLYTRAPLRLVELARFCEIDPAGMTRLIDRLERGGLCHRSRLSSDRRVVEVVLTQRGAESAKRVAPVLDRLQVELLAGFDTEQRKNFLRLLARMATGTRISDRSRRNHDGQAITNNQESRASFEASRNAR
ncbi:MarR family winged helix-turn-helix transcriptional regulator [Variovorax paradoxus]|uniref:MarR family winged helix-turn-helix transcriptional regulator n=1 Tax=Variovorax paradoxus TaxID=34073 RepID=UPI00188599A5|nr:MarR family transcriptional regulator [Variovorax paradoxus]